MICIYMCIYIYIYYVYDKHVVVSAGYPRCLKRSIDSPFGATYESCRMMPWRITLRGSLDWRVDVCCCSLCFVCFWLLDCIAILVGPRIVTAQSPSCPRWGGLGVFDICYVRVCASLSFSYNAPTPLKGGRGYPQRERGRGGLPASPECYINVISCN